MWLLVMWVRGGLGGLRTTSSRILTQCWPSNGAKRRARRRRLSQTGARAVGSRSTALVSPTGPTKAEDEKVEDASEKVVKMALEETEGGKRYELLWVVRDTLHGRTNVSSAFKRSAESRASEGAGPLLAKHDIWHLPSECTLRDKTRAFHSACQQSFLSEPHQNEHCNHSQPWSPASSNSFSMTR